MRVTPKTINTSTSPLRRAASHEQAAAAAAKASDIELRTVLDALEPNHWAEFTPETFDDYWLARAIEAEQTRRAKRRKRATAALKSQGPTVTSTRPKITAPGPRKPLHKGAV